MTAATLAAPATRFVDYLDAAVAAAIPVQFPMWYAEESCRRVDEVAAELDGPAAEDLLGRAAEFVDDVLMTVKADVLPFELAPSVYVDPAGELQLIGTRRGRKIRVDSSLSVALVRTEPVALEGPRALGLRAEVRELFCFSLGSGDRRPVAAIESIDLSTVGDPGAFYLELDAPTGGGYLGGRFDRLRAFGDGKVLLVRFRPVATEGEPAFDPPAGSGEAGAGAGAGPESSYT